ncbi:MAG TPA: tetratricopeptide repeat protein [Polyangia bacterium]|nr:tetratricopeptide repeat protein [Polyangia bacterium]
MEKAQVGVVGFVGRRGELAALDEALGRATRFSVPQTVTIVGADGLGKSRLVDAWLAARAGDELRIVRAAVEPVVGGSAPRGALIAHLLRVRFGLAELDPEQALLRFRAQLQEVFGDRRISELSTLLGRFLGFEPPDSPLGSALAGRPEQGVELARAVLGRFLEQDAAGRPLIVIGENLQDADDDSLTELERLSAELADAPILIVATARPDLLVRRPGWGHGGGNHVRIDLQPLTRMEIDLLVAAQLGPAAAVPPGLAEQVANASGGSPQLAGEVLRAYREHEILVPAPAGDGWRFDEARASRQHPSATREEVAHARITVLTPAERDVLARAAIFGDQFWTGGVVALGRLEASPPDEAAVFAPDPTITEIQQILESLRERGFVERVERSAIPEETAWAFCQTIERRLLEAEAASELGRRRKAFAAQWLESRGGGETATGAAAHGSEREQRLEWLARLYLDAGDARRAATAYVTAAGLARDHLLLDRAQALYLAGLRLYELDDAVAKMDTLYAAGDVAARLGRTRESVGLFQEMLRLAWRLDLPAKGGAAHGRIGRLLSTLGENARARAHLELAQKLFEVAGDWPGVAAALDDVGRIHFLMGEPERSLERHRAALGVREQLGDDRGRALTLSRLGQVLRATGALSGAGEHFRAALELRRRISDRPGVIASLQDLGALERDLGRRPEALSLLGEGRDLARASGERLHECSLSIEIGDCHLADGQPHAGLAEFQAAREIARQFGARVLLSEATRGIAEAELAMGEATRARDDARSAFEIAERAGAPPLAGAALRVAASAVGAGAPGEPELGGAREMFDRAVEVLTGAGAEMELARTLDAYAEFEDRSGRDETANELRRQARLIRRREQSGAPRAA